MKSLILLALTTVVTSAVWAQSTIQDDWNTGPVLVTGGRDGWRHNSEIFDAYLNSPGGDIFSHVTWNTSGSNGWIEARDAASGSGEYFVAPARFVPNGGNLLGLQAATLSFDFARFLPAVSTSGNGTFQVRLYKGFGYVRTTINPATAYPDFFSTASVWRNFSLNLLDTAIWTPGVDGEGFTPTVEEVLSGVDRILIGGEVRSGSETNGLDNVVLSYTLNDTPSEVKSDFNEAPGGADGREGWIHNFNRAIDGFTGVPQGDLNSRLYWGTDSIDRYLQILEAAGGSNDLFVAPSRYIVENGRFDLLTTASFRFKWKRINPDTTTWTGSTGNDLRSAVRLRLYNGTSFAQWQVPVNEIDQNFYNTVGQWWEFNPDLTDRTKWSVGREGSTSPQLSLDEILAGVSRVAVVGEIRSGSEINALDDFAFTYQRGETLQGTFVFDARETNPPSGVTLEFREVGTTNVLHTRRAPVRPDGTYEVLSVPTGTYDIVVKPRGFLSRTLRNSPIEGSMTGLDLAFVNGDIDGDNSVTVFDYDKLSAFFDKTSADSDWATADADGIAPRDADLDGDGAVTVFDYDVLSRNFDQIGD